VETEGVEAAAAEAGADVSRSALGFSETSDLGFATWSSKKSLQIFWVEKKIQI